ncbi:MAG: DUF4416 family protein [Pirellulales bacterium]
MAVTTQPADVLLILAAISRYGEALDWARQEATERWGAVALESDRFSFTETDYYQPTMGSHLLKTFLVFERLIDPAELAAIKLETNTWEADYAKLQRHPEPRPLNLDPGYLTPAKLVLASTKDHSHRVYLSRGIFAEVTLYYKAGRWQHREWTYPDYRRPDFQQFFSRARDYLLNTPGGRPASQGTALGEGELREGGPP